mgnify:FL=1
MTKYIVFDRDGTLIKHIPYLFEANKVELLPTVKKSLELLKSNGFIFFLHTNQSGISRKYFNKSDVDKCNNKLLSLIGMGSNLFEEICIAEDYPANKITYRKPSPKFGIEIMEKYKINKENLFYVGDSLSDLETAQNIGCKCFGVNTGLIDLNIQNQQNLKFDISKSLYEVAIKIINS